MEVLEIANKADFDAQIADGLVVVDFWAEWCGPCQMIRPVFEQLSDQKPEVKFLKVNVDNVPDVSQECRITAMPTFIFYKNGQKVDEVVGASAPQLKNKVNEFAKN